MTAAPQAYAPDPPRRMAPTGTEAKTRPSRAQRATTASIDPRDGSRMPVPDPKMQNPCRGSAASCGEVLHQGSSLVCVSEAAPATQLWHEEVDDAKQIARRRHWVREHEAAAAAGRLEHLFHVVGDLRGGASDGAVVSGCALEPVLKKFFARDLGIGPDIVRQLVDEAHRRGIGRRDLIVEFLEREACRKLREIVARVMR